MDIFDTNEEKKEEKSIEKEISDLDDIILNKKEKRFDVKKIALLGGSAILILLIVISIVKLTSQNQNSVENEDFFASKEPASVGEEEKNFEQVPIVKEEPEEPEKEFEKIEKEVIEEKEPTSVSEEEKKEEIKLAKKEVPASAIKPEKSTKKIEAKKIAKVLKEYYIQVGAFYRLAPDRKFLNKIRKNGFNYVIKTIVNDSSEVKKVLIGPFTSRSEAKKALLKVRKTIKKDAFITKVK